MYKLDENTMLEPIDQIRLHNFPANDGSFSYICRVYREYKRDKFGWKEVEGDPIYLKDMSPEQSKFAVIMGVAQNALLSTVNFNENIPIYNEEEDKKR